MSNSLSSGSNLVNTFSKASTALNIANTMQSMSDTIGTYLGMYMQSGLDSYGESDQKGKDQFLSNYSKDTASYLLSTNKITPSDYQRYIGLLDENKQQKEYERQDTVATDIFSKLPDNAQPDQIAEAIGEAMSQGVPLEKATQKNDEMFGTSNANTYSYYISNALMVTKNAIDNAEGIINTKYFKHNKRMKAKIDNSLNEITGILNGYTGQGFMSGSSLGLSYSKAEFYRKALPIKVVSRLQELRKQLIAKKNST